MTDPTIGEKFTTDLARLVRAMESMFAPLADAAIKVANLRVSLADGAVETRPPTRPVTVDGINPALTGPQYAALLHIAQDDSIPDRHDFDPDHCVQCAMADGALDAFRKVKYESMFDGTQMTPPEEGPPACDAIGPSGSRCVRPDPHLPGEHQFPVGGVHRER